MSQMLKVLRYKIKNISQTMQVYYRFCGGFMAVEFFCGMGLQYRKGMMIVKFSSVGECDGK